MEPRGSFQIIHAHDWLVAYCGKALKHAYQRPLVATIHATEAGRNQGLHNEQQGISAVWNGGLLMKHGG